LSYPNFILIKLILNIKYFFALKKSEEIIIIKIAMGMTFNPGN